MVSATTGVVLLTAVLALAALGVRGSHPMNGGSFSCRSFSNGCSAPSLTPYRSTFTPACDTHDVCYHCGARFGIGKSRCDIVFLRNMINLCSSQGLGLSCQQAARHYYDAVMVFGHSRYNWYAPLQCRDNRIRSQCLRGH